MMTMKEVVKLASGNADSTLSEIAIGLFRVIAEDELARKGGAEGTWSTCSDNEFLRRFDMRGVSREQFVSRGAAVASVLIEAMVERWIPGRGVRLGVTNSDDPDKGPVEWIWGQGLSEIRR